MVATVLVAEDIAGGEDVVRALDADHVDLRAAFWFYLPDSDEYRLMLVLPLVDRQGPDAGYKTVDKTLRKHRLDLSLLKISVIGPKYPVARALRRAIGAYGAAAGAKRHIRLRREFSEGISIEDAYVYRSK
jgi:hypothetical protein